MLSVTSASWFTNVLFAKTTLINGISLSNRGQIAELLRHRIGETNQESREISYQFFNTSNWYTTQQILSTDRYIYYCDLLALKTVRNFWKFYHKFSHILLLYQQLIENRSHQSIIFIQECVKCANENIGVCNARDCQVKGKIRKEKRSSWWSIMPHQTTKWFNCENVQR